MIANAEVMGIANEQRNQQVGGWTDKQMNRGKLIERFCYRECLTNKQILKKLCDRHTDRQTEGGRDKQTSINS